MHLPNPTTAVHFSIGLVLLDFMPYKSLYVIWCQILFMHIYQIYNLLTHFGDNIFKQVWAHVFLTQLNGFKYFYPIWIILFAINHLLSQSLLVSNITF